MLNEIRNLTFWTLLGIYESDRELLDGRHIDGPAYEDGEMLPMPDDSIEHYLDRFRFDAESKMITCRALPGDNDENAYEKVLTELEMVQLCLDVGGYY